MSRIFNILNDVVLPDLAEALNTSSGGSSQVPVGVEGDIVVFTGTSNVPRVQDSGIKLSTQMLGLDTATVLDFTPLTPNKNFLGYVVSGGLPTPTPDFMTIQSENNLLLVNDQDASNIGGLFLMYNFSNNGSIQIGASGTNSTTEISAMSSVSLQQVDNSNGITLDSNGITLQSTFGDITLHSLNAGKINLFNEGSQGILIQNQGTDNCNLEILNQGVGAGDLIIRNNGNGDLVLDNLANNIVTPQLTGGYIQTDVNGVWSIGSGGGGGGVVGPQNILPIFTGIASPNLEDSGLWYGNELIDTGLSGDVIDFNPANLGKRVVGSFTSLVFSDNLRDNLRGGPGPGPTPSSGTALLSERDIIIASAINDVESETNITVGNYSSFGKITLETPDNGSIDIKSPNIQIIDVNSGNGLSINNSGSSLSAINGSNSNFLGLTIYGINISSSTGDINMSIPSGSVNDGRIWLLNRGSRGITIENEGTSGVGDSDLQIFNNTGAGDLIIKNEGLGNIIIENSTNNIVTPNLTGGYIQTDVNGVWSINQLGPIGCSFIEGITQTVPITTSQIMTVSIQRSDWGLATSWNGTLFTAPASGIYKYTLTFGIPATSPVGLNDQVLFGAIDGVSNAANGIIYPISYGNSICNALTLNQGQTLSFILVNDNVTTPLIVHNRFLVIEKIN